MNWNCIAGFFGGEGLIACNRKSFHIIIEQTDEKILNKIRNFIGIDCVVKVRKRKNLWQNY